MNYKIIVLTLAFALAITACTPSTSQNNNSNNNQNGNTNQNNDSMMQYKDMVRLDQPSANATISSPLVISGEARGTWYFEASFPIEVKAADGEVLATTIATAQDDWMTESYVPFETTLAFDPKGNTQGFIVLHKDNPSGLPENADSFSIPVNFSVDTASVNVYFANEQTGNTDCSLLTTVSKPITRTTGVAQAALKLLLAGPSLEDTQNGLSTALNSNVKLNSIKIENGTAYADFSSELNENVGGSCRVTTIRAQISDTLKQFDTVDEVVISVNGESETILQP